jgi:hypothetical protein
MMKTPAKPALAAMLALSLTGSMAVSPLAATDPKPAPQRSCFYARNIENYAIASDRLVYLRVSAADIYRLDLMSDCPELSFRESIRITHSGASDLVCNPIDLTIRFRQIGARRVCPVSEMRKLTPAEVAALPKRDRP